MGETFEGETVEADRVRGEVEEGEEVEELEEGEEVEELEEVEERSMEDFGGTLALVGINPLPEFPLPEFPLPSGSTSSGRPSSSTSSGRPSSSTSSGRPPEATMENSWKRDPGRCLKVGSQGHTNS